MPEALHFQYDETEIQYLKSRDPVLGAVIDQIGHIKREINPDMFTALVKAIVGQQISTKAQATIWAKMLNLCDPMTPQTLIKIPKDQLQVCGISFKKVFYIKEIAHSVLDKSLDLEQLKTLSDDAVCSRLIQIKGVGVWTAEMLMIFCMQRQNILSFGDLAILRGLRMLYRHREITPALFSKYKRRYSPYASVASLYIWAVSNGACPELYDPAPMAQAKQTRAKNLKKL